MPRSKAMPEPINLPKIPTFKRDLIALWKQYGPGWMLAALVVCVSPWALAAAGYFLRGIAELLKVLR
jgi:hypothetical protein